MKGFSRYVLAGAMLAAAASASADLAYNVSVTSDYRFRGISQSAQDPALQGGVDYSHASGFYAGGWASTIDFEGEFNFSPPVDADLEVDFYGGYKWKVGGIDLDAGLILYAYPGADSVYDLDFTEVYIGGTFGQFFAKFFYTDDYTGNLTTESAYYITGGANLELGGGYTLGLSVGKSGGDGIEESWGDTYMDYKVGVTKEFAGISFNLAYIDNDLKPEITTDLFNSEAKLVLTGTKSF